MRYIGFMGSLTAIGMFMLLTQCATPKTAHIGLSKNTTEPTSDEKPVNFQFISQLKSFSFDGAKQAVLVEANSRDARLTSDAGQTWTMIPGNDVIDSFECITMTGSEGWAVSRSGNVFKTTSMGKSWIKLAEPKDSDGNGIAACQQIEFVNANEGWLLEGLSIWHTDDGGVSWQHTLSPSTPQVQGVPHRLAPLSSGVLVSAGTNGEVYLTKDGGRTWTVKTLVAERGDFTDISFVDGKRGWICGFIGGKGFRPLLFATEDGGETWIEIPLAEKDVMLKSVSFVENEGWLAGHRYIPNNETYLLEPVLLHTNDGGKQWRPVLVDSHDPFFRLVRFADQRHGWLFGRDNLYYTDDGGNAWRHVLSLQPLL